MLNRFNRVGSRAKIWPLIAMFLLGLGSQTKFYFIGCVAFSEIAVFVLAPLLLFRNWFNMRRDGFLPFLGWSVIIMCAMALSSWINHTPIPYVIKTVALIYAVVCYYIVFYVLLRQNFSGLGWFYLGFAISLVIITFAFNPSAEVTESGFGQLAQKEVDEIVGGPLYWIQRLRGFGQIPIISAYLKTPLVYSLCAPILFAAFALLTTSSGRSESLAVLLGGAMILVGRKSRITMRKLRRRFGLFLVLGGVVVFAYMGVYKYAATHGILSTDAEEKFNAQSGGGKGGAFRVLMSGRKEFFIGLSAALDRPFFGFGPRPYDTHGYATKFLTDYGTQADFDYHQAVHAIHMHYGTVAKLPTHSHIVGAWVFYGITGLLFYIWLLYKIYQHIRFYSGAIPQWYGYFALTISSYLWHIFFSPFGDRAPFSLFVCTLFFARAIGRGKLILPIDMEIEARKYE